MFARQSLPLNAIRLAHSQGGAISRGQLIGAGTTHQVVKRMLRDGELQPVTRGVHAIGAATWLTRAWAGLLVGGEGACLSGLAAAHLWNLAPPPGVIEVRTVQHPHGREGYHFVRGSATSSGLVPPRTSLERTAVTLASRSRSQDDVVHWLTRALAQSADLTRLAGEAAAVPNLRRRREILEQLDQLEAGVESVLELRYLQAVERDHRLPRPQRQVALGGDRLDLLYRDLGVVIELDGRLGHADAGVFRDLRRDNRHAERGLVTLRFGWDDVTGHPCAVAAQIGATLRARGWIGQVARCPQCRASPAD